MTRFVNNLIAEETGATMVEYALLVALIGAAMVVTLGTLKSAINTKFTSVASTISSAS
jgi:pilus assembly protein Flp/PilA